MADMNKDILQNPEMKKTPYSVPEGYFDSLKKEALRCKETPRVRLSLWGRLAPYASIAAMFLFILLLGKIFIRKAPETTAETYEENTYEDFLVFSDMTSEMSMHYLADESIDLSDEEIIEYLIYIGATEEYIESDNN